MGKCPIDLAFGNLWNRSVVRVNVATTEGVAFGISHTITKRLELTSGSSLGFRLRPHNRRDPQPRRDRQTGNQKKSMRAATLNWKKEHVCWTSFGRCFPPWTTPWTASGVQIMLMICFHFCWEGMFFRWAACVHYQWAAIPVMLEAATDEER